VKKGGEGGEGGRGGGGEKKNKGGEGGGGGKLSTFLLATNDILENKPHLNKLCFTELGNKRCPNYAPRFASGT